MSKPRYRDSNRHALERAKLRYGADLTDEDLKEMVAKIQRGEARYAGIDYPTNSFWFIDHKGETYRVVYNGREKRICTFIRPRELQTEDKPEPPKPIGQAPLS